MIGVGKYARLLVAAVFTTLLLLLVSGSRFELMYMLLSVNVR